MLPTGARSETWRAPRCGAQRHGASSKPATRVRGASSKPATRVRGASSKPATRVRGVRDSRTWSNLRLAHVQTAYFREIKRLAHVAGAMEKQRLAHVAGANEEAATRARGLAQIKRPKLHAECLGQTKSYHTKQINLLGSYLAASFRRYGERKENLPRKSEDFRNDTKQIAHCREWTALWTALWTIESTVQCCVLQ